MTDIPALRNFRPKRISWLTIILAALAVGTFFAVSDQGGSYAIPMMGFGGEVMETSGNYGTIATPPTAIDMPMRDISVSGDSMQGMMGSGAYYPYPYYDTDVPVTDAREFLKVYYNATMQTRDVPALTRRVETTVQGYDGRIDQESSSPRSGYVSFAVPQSKYEAFRSELEGLVGSRFLTVNISSQNLLPQKRNIEEQQKQADSTLADYKTARQRVVSTHTSTVQSLQSQIDADTQELATLRAQDPTPQVRAQIQIVSDDAAALKQQLDYENSSYTTRLANADANIKYAQDWQKAVQTQDQTLLDSVATVTGTVSIEWISLWEMAQLYLPGYWIPAIFALLAFFSLLSDRRRFGTA
ncbi:DUF4349 domain-containing protein [Candidatus Kaiserbacteria bacterium]|nr:DUF4349 domain-containing protein [Candidatus Kaiserbacteria bacterium]